MPQGGLPQIPETLPLDINTLIFHSTRKDVQIPRPLVDRRREQLIPSINALVETTFSEGELELIKPRSARRKKRVVKNDEDFPTAKRTERVLSATVNMQMQRMTSIEGGWESNKGTLQSALTCAIKDGQLIPYVKIGVSRNFESGSISLLAVQNAEGVVSRTLILKPRVETGNESSLSFVIGKDACVEAVVQGKDPSVAAHELEAIFGNIDIQCAVIEGDYRGEVYKHLRALMFEKV